MVGTARENCPCLHVDLVALGVREELDVRPCIQAGGIKHAHILACGRRGSCMDIEVCAPNGGEHTCQGGNMLKLLIREMTESTIIDSDSRSCSLPSCTPA